MLTRHQRIGPRLPRVLAHPFEFAVALMFITAGGNSMNYLIHIKQQLRVGLLALPLPLLWTWIITIVIGATLVVISFFQPGSKVMVRATERAGLCLSAAAWLSIAIVWAHLDIHHPGNWLQYVWITLGCVLRLWVMHKHEMALRKAVEVMEPES